MYNCIFFSFTHQYTFLYTDTGTTQQTQKPSLPPRSCVDGRHGEIFEY